MGEERDSAKATIQNIRRKTRRKYSAEEKIRIGCFIRECKLIPSEHCKAPRNHTYWRTHTKTRAQKWLGAANFEGLFPFISTAS